MNDEGFFAMMAREGKRLGYRFRFNGNVLEGFRRDGTRFTQATRTRTIDDEGWAKVLGALRQAGILDEATGKEDA